MAHNAGASLRQGIREDKLAAVWDYRASDLFTAAERVALDFAVAAAAQPNAVTDELFGRMLEHWTEGQVVEITALVAHFGFLNRWNDTMATPLEAQPLKDAEEHLAQHGWQLGRHRAPPPEPSR